MSTRRRYRSELREERARETRLRIRKSARRLFTDKGFVETTVAQIAADAGVSAQTVYASYGSKAAIVGAMLDELEGAIDEARVDKLKAEQDPRRQLQMFVSTNRTLFEQGAPILRAAFAASGDPDVAAMGRRGDDNRREGTRQLARRWAAVGALRSGLKEKDAADRFWLLTSPEQFLLAIDRLSWTPARYHRWLVSLLETELLGLAP